MLLLLLLATGRFPFHHASTDWIQSGNVVTLPTILKAANWKKKHDILAWNTKWCNGYGLRSKEREGFSSGSLIRSQPQHLGRERDNSVYLGRAFSKAVQKKPGIQCSSLWTGLSCQLKLSPGQPVPHATLPLEEGSGQRIWAPEIKHPWGRCTRLRRASVLPRKRHRYFTKVWNASTKRENPSTPALAPRIIEW